MQNRSPFLSIPACAPLWRRLAAIAYDALLLAAVWFIAAIPFAVAAGGNPMSPLLLHLFQIYLLAVAAVFFIGFWLRGGQTLGMRAWRLRVQTASGAALTWHLALLRFLYALVSWAAFGLGFIWALRDRDRCTWHDRWSRTRLVATPPTQR